MDARRHDTIPEDVTLLDVLIDGFEKNEVLEGRHWRELPLPDEPTAARAFTRLSDEARRWKGEAERIVADAPRRIASWRDIEIRQTGRGVLILVRSPYFGDWWHSDETWRGEPLREIWEWIEEDRTEAQS